MRRGLTKALIRAIETGKLESFGFNDLLEHARMNKVELGFLKAVGGQEALSHELEMLREEVSVDDCDLPVRGG